MNWTRDAPERFLFRSELECYRVSTDLVWTEPDLNWYWTTVILRRTYHRKSFLKPINKQHTLIACIKQQYIGRYCSQNLETCTKINRIFWFQKRVKALSPLSFERPGNPFARLTGLIFFNLSKNIQSFFGFRVTVITLNEQSRQVSVVDDLRNSLACFIRCTSKSWAQTHGCVLLVNTHSKSYEVKELVFENLDVVVVKFSRYRSSSRVNVCSLVWWNQFFESDGLF